MKHKPQVALIEGEIGAIEVRHFGLTDEDEVVAPAENDKNVFSSGERLVVICHPHTLYGGTMDNKVVTTLEKAFQQAGFATVCFNFRGAGRSEGAYDNGVGEQVDLARVVAWARQQLEQKWTQMTDRTGDSELFLEKTFFFLAGFSFGSYVALQAHAKVGADALLTVAPPVGLYDLSQVAVEVPWSVIQGGQDEVMDAAEVMDWVRQQTPMPDLYWRSPASHFFHRQLLWLRDATNCVISGV